jgi:hypothetical protein
MDCLRIAVRRLKVRPINQQVKLSSSDPKTSRQRSVSKNAAEQI